MCYNPPLYQLSYLECGGASRHQIQPATRSLWLRSYLECGI